MHKYTIYRCYNMFQCYKHRCFMMFLSFVGCNIEALFLPNGVPD